MALKYSLTPSHTSFIWPELWTSNRENGMYIHLSNVFYLLDCVKLRANISGYRRGGKGNTHSITQLHVSNNGSYKRKYEGKTYVAFSGSVVETWEAYCWRMSFTVCFFGSLTSCSAVISSWITVEPLNNQLGEFIIGGSTMYTSQRSLLYAMYVSGCGLQCLFLSGDKIPVICQPFLQLLWNLHLDLSLWSWVPLQITQIYSGTSLNGLPFMRKPLYCAQFTRNGTHRRIMPIHFALSIAETSAFRIANEICIPYIV